MPWCGISLVLPIVLLRYIHQVLHGGYRDYVVTPIFGAIDYAAAFAQRDDDVVYNQVHFLGILTFNSKFGGKLTGLQISSPSQVVCVFETCAYYGMPSHPRAGIVPPHVLMPPPPCS